MRQVCVFVCYYAQENTEVDLELRTFGDLFCREFVSMESNDLGAVNTFADPESVKPVEHEPVAMRSGRAAVRLAPMSWNFLRFEY